MSGHGLFYFLHYGQAIWQARQDVMMGHECKSLLRLFSVRNVVNDDDEMPRDALTVADHDPVGGENAHIASRHLDLIVAGTGAQFSAESLIVRCVNALRILCPIDFEY